MDAKRILIVGGSPRRGGNTDTLCAALAAGAAEGGAETEYIRLHGLDISPCLGCGGCAKTGKCVVKDGMEPLYEAIDAAYGIVIASPIYFYALSAQAKLFIDRLQAFWSRRRLPGAATTAAPERFGYLVAVAATRGDRLFEGAILCARYAFEAMGARYGGAFVVRGMDRRGAVAASPETMARAGRFGKKVAGGEIHG